MATTHVDPVLSAVTFATRMPMGVARAIVESREAYITTGLLVDSARKIAVSEVANGVVGFPVAGFAEGLTSATISWPVASKPSTQILAE